MHTHTILHTKRAPSTRNCFYTYARSEHWRNQSNTVRQIVWIVWLCVLFLLIIFTLRTQTFCVHSTCWCKWVSAHMLCGGSVRYLWVCKTIRNSIIFSLATHLVCWARTIIATMKFACSLYSCSTYLFFCSIPFHLALYLIFIVSCFLHASCSSSGSACGGWRARCKIKIVSSWFINSTFSQSLFHGQNP